MDEDDNVIIFPRIHKGRPSETVVDYLASAGIFDAVIVGQNFLGNFVFICASDMSRDRATFLLEKGKLHALNDSPERN